MMDFDVVQDFLWTVVQIFLAAALPVVVKAGLDWLKEAVAGMRSGLTVQQNELINTVVQKAIQAAQQLKANGVLPDGQAAKEYAMEVIQRELDRLGIELDAVEIANAIEAGYRGYLHYSMGPEMIREVVADMVQAYRDSGIDDQVKALAAIAADRYLRRFGVTVDLDILEDLALAQIQELAGGAVGF
jgi:hypothetical protein